MRILSTDGAGREVKVGMVVPVQQTAAGERRGRARYAASLKPAAAFGQRLALVAHQQGGERAARVAVLGDGAAWIWNLAAEHLPHAVQIVDWFHASERIWLLGQGAVRRGHRRDHGLGGVPVSALSRGSGAAAGRGLANPGLCGSHRRRAR